MLSEILAIRLLRNYNTRDLIDALSYEFYPLQGQTPSMDPIPRVSGGKQADTTRISCLEVAIRAQAKRFLSHPVVVQQLKAIWSGIIVFHSAADNLHRQPQRPRSQAVPTTYGTNSGSRPFHGRNPSKASEKGAISLRRSVTLYDPRDASLFKLSRLRVPLYRHVLSTLSYAILLVLFLAVLKERRNHITILEVVFWFWSAGFMLDEIVGFNEQGFSLYLMSFWNLFDLGILLLLFCYYCLRLSAVMIPSPQSRVIASKAYDVLAANAVLLFPRLFSTLDHYRYFSQLLIAFRMMAFDLVAVILLVIVACSGFFVAFISFSENYYSPGSVAFGLFQMIMGYTPTAWALWDEYNALGRAILTIFLFICHFVVVTILITVLTNSFMAIVQNAYQEHQFLFAVNTISMVKSDALFAYVAPTNILAWMITPLRYWMHFRQFVKLNRTIIKITHFPILFTICLYEKVILGPRVIQPADFIEREARSERGQKSPHGRFHAFKRNASRLVREPSVTSYQKDRALEEVFRKPFRDDSVQDPMSKAQQQQSSNIVRNWIRGMSPGSGHPPAEQNPIEAERGKIRLRGPRRFSGFLPDFTEETRSVPSNPEDYALDPKLASHYRRSPMRQTGIRQEELFPHADSEGDDEMTSEENEDETEDKQSGGQQSSSNQLGESANKSTPKFYRSRPSTAKLLSRKSSPVRRHRDPTRNTSVTTTLFNPSHEGTDSDGTRSPNLPKEMAIPSSSRHRKHKRRSVDEASGIRTNSRSSALSDPDIEGSSTANLPGRAQQRFHIPFELGSDLGDNRAAVTSGFVGAEPSSFSTRMAAYATRGKRRMMDSETDANNDMLSKLVLARMNNIEEGFREVIKEVKDLRREGSSRSQSGTDPLLHNVPGARRRRGDNRGINSDRMSSKEKRRQHSPAKGPVGGNSAPE